MLAIDRLESEMNKAKKKDPRFWRRWRFCGAVFAEAVLRAARDAVATGNFAPPDTDEDACEAEARVLPNGVKELVLRRNVRR